MNKYLLIIYFFVYLLTLVVGFVVHDREMKKYELFLKENERIMLVDLATEFHFRSSSEFKDIIVCRLYFSHEDVSDIIEIHGQEFARMSEVILKAGELIGVEGVYELYELTEKDLKALCSL